jgi:integrase
MAKKAIRDKSGRRVPRYFIYTPTGEIYVRAKFQALGIPPIDENTHEKTIGRAKARGEQLIQRHKNRYLGVPDHTVFGHEKALLLKDIISEAYHELIRGKRETTVEQYAIYFAKLTDLFGAEDVRRVSPTSFNQEIDKLRRRVDRTTFSDYAKYMNIVMRFAYERKYTTHLLRFKMPEKELASANSRVFSKKELRLLYLEMNCRTRMQFTLSYECMMRLREVLYLEWNRVNLKTGKIILRKENVKTGSKTGKGREFFLGKNALLLIREWAANTKRSSPYVFPSRFDPRKPQHDNKTAWRRAKRDAKIKGKATWHALRHTALTHSLLDKKLNPLSISEYAGVSIRTIQSVYLHSKAEHTKDVAGALSLEDS